MYPVGRSHYWTHPLNNQLFPAYRQRELRSSFDAPSPIGDASLVESVLKLRRSLVAIIDPSQFKTYDELKRKLDLIVGVAKTA